MIAKVFDNSNAVAENGFVQAGVIQLDKIPAVRRFKPPGLSIKAAFRFGEGYSFQPIYLTDEIKQTGFVSCIPLNFTVHGLPPRYDNFGLASGFVRCLLSTLTIFHITSEKAKPLYILHFAGTRNVARHACHFECC